MSAETTRAAPTPPTGLAAAIAAARALHAVRPILSAAAIHIERIAFRAGATVVWGATGAADAHVTRGRDVAYICVDERQRGTPRGRFSIAHELGHWLLHRDVDADAFERIHAGGAKTGRDFKYEAEANTFASHVLTPHEVFAPMCCAARPAVADVDTVARAFGVSLMVCGHRYAEIAPSACAFVESYGGQISRVTRSTAFRGVAVQRRKLEEGTAAFALANGDASGEGWRVVRGDVWGRDGIGGAEMIEHAIAIPESGAVVSWLWHADGRGDRGAPRSDGADRR